MRRFEVIVLGLGGMGGAALYHLARRGVAACGVEQYGLAHAQGSAHGRTRLIRRAYFEHPGYVPLVDASWRWWQALETETSTPLLRKTGLLLAGPPDGPVIRGTRTAARMHDLDIPTFSHGEAERRWPGFAYADGTEIVFETDAGVLHVEACVRAHVQAAERRGAEALFNAPVHGWHADGSGVRVTTADETIAADRLIVCGGAWTSRLLSSAAPPLRVLRKTVFWYPECTPAMHVDSDCPVFGFDTPAGFCYGFPQFDAAGVKVANHSGGEEVADPDKVVRTVTAAEADAVDAFRRTHLVGVRGPAGERGVCLYTMSPDEHFVIDTHPRHANVIVACGFSGHGFKFAPVIGETLAAAACGNPIEHGLFQPLMSRVRES